MEDYWRLHAIPNLEPQTRATYRQQWAEHILPRLGDYELRAINAQLILSDLVEPMRRAGAGDPTLLQVLAVLQAIFAYAVMTERVIENPVRRVAKPRQPGGREVPPVPPATVEQLRERLGSADALMVAVLAYAGLRPQELLALQCNDIHERAILVRRKNVNGELYPYTKTRTNRRVRLLAPLGADLAEWVLASGRRGHDLVVPNARGLLWTKHQYQHWRRHVHKPNAAAVGLTSGVPYDLRGSFVSLLAWEGQNMLKVARQAGHSVAICERHYAGIFEDYDPANRTSAEAAIRAAREPGVRGVCALFDEGAQA